jgi:protocatechuate 3,4-dioxygenase beta subunit
MSQFGRPIADTLIDNWQTQAGGVTNIYQQIDEAIADEADFARTQLFPTSDVLVVKLTC